MTIKFINPEGKLNQADLTEEQVSKLKQLEGYTVLEKPRLRISISDDVCLSCQG